MTETDDKQEQETHESAGSGGSSPAFAVTVHDGISHIRPVRVPTINDCIATALDLIEQGNHPLRLWDYSGMIFPFSIDDLKLLADASIDLNKTPVRVATLVHDDLGYGSMRVFAAHFGSSKTPLSVFRDEAAAIRWLKEG